VKSMMRIQDECLVKPTKNTRERMDSGRTRTKDDGTRTPSAK